jgi:mannosyltransferase
VPAGALALLYVPWVILLAVNVLSPTGAWRSGTSWIPEPSLAHVARTFQAYSGSLPLTIVLTVLAGYGLFRITGKQRPGAYLLLAWLLVPIAVPLLVSHLYRPMLVDRYTIAASPAFYLLATQGFDIFKGRYFKERGYVQAFLVALIAALSLASILGYFSAVTKQPWRDVAGYVDVHARTGDLVLLYGGLLPFDYYSERADIDKEAFRVKKNAGIKKSITTAVEGRDKVWLVVFWETGREKGLLPKRLTKLYGNATYRENYAVNDLYNNEVATVPYQGNGINLFLFERSGTRKGVSK